jgi:N-acetylglutamate synthase-like GNAT family acetyltransferase
VIQIRAASKTDIEWINHRYKEVDFVPSIFEKEVIAVAEFKGVRAGLGRLVTLDEQNAELGGMYVFEPYRGKGVAKEIVQFLLNQGHRFQTIYCIPFEHLAPFYQRYGFAPCPNLDAVPRELISKYQWCKQQYPQATSLLFRRSV